MESFTRLFETTLSRAPYKGDSADKRNKGLKNTLQDQVYQYVTRSLFKADRLAFAIHLGKIIKKMDFIKTLKKLNRPNCT